jgi:excinuclease UvrABC helicase subunit UvrB
MDNRPLKFEEFQAKMKNVVAVSATPGKFDIEMSCDNPDKFFDFDPIVD